MTTRRKQLLFWAISLAASLLVCDVVARRGIAFIHARSAMTHNDPDIGFLLDSDVATKYEWAEAPGGSFWRRTNNMGFREDAPTTIAKTREHRVMVFGDSHTEGAVDNASSFTNVAEAALAAQGRDVEMINCGRGNFSVYQQLLLLERLLPLAPDIVIITVYAGNDYLDIMIRENRPYLLPVEGQRAKRALPEQPRATLAERAWQMLSDFSTGCYLIDGWSKRRWEQRLLAAAPPRLQRLRAAEAISTGPVWQSLNQASFFEEQPDRFAVASDLHRQLVTELIDTTRRHGSRLLFIILPSKRQVERHTAEAVFAETEAVLGLAADAKWEDAVRDDLRAMLTAAGVPFVDPYDVFREHALSGGEPLYWTKDHHLDIRGHALLASLLAEELGILLDETANQPSR